MLLLKQVANFTRHIQRIIFKLSEVLHKHCLLITKFKVRWACL